MLHPTTLPGESHQDKPTGKDHECQDLGSSLAQLKKMPPLLGLGCAAEKLQPEPTATRMGQRAKPQGDPRVAKIQPQPKDGPLGTLLPPQGLKKTKQTENGHLTANCQGLSKRSRHYTSGDLLGGFTHLLTPHPCTQ